MHSAKKCTYCVRAADEVCDLHLSVRKCATVINVYDIIILYKDIDQLQ